MKNINTSLNEILYNYTNDLEHLRNQDERVRCRNRYRLAIEALYEPLGRGEIVKIIDKAFYTDKNGFTHYGAWDAADAIINARGER